MGTVTGIAWADSTFNPWIGCTKVGPGCDHCYASVSTPARSLGVKWGAGEARHRTSAANWRKPRAWNAEAERTGVRRRVFCASLADVFDNEVPTAWRVDLLRLIEATPHLDWLLLTKRIGNVDRLLDEAAPLMAEVLRWPLLNVWLGATVVNQAEADRDIPKLLATPAATRFVSYEPAVGPVDWTRYLVPWNHAESRYGKRLDWIIVGGESDQPGMRARPFDVQWARDTVCQCREAGVPCFVKQIGSWPVSDSMFDFPSSWSPDMDEPILVPLADRSGADPVEWPEDLRVQEFPNER